MNGGSVSIGDWDVTVRWTARDEITLENPRRHDYGTVNATAITGLVRALDHYIIAITELRAVIARQETELAEARRLRAKFEHLNTLVDALQRKGGDATVVEKTLTLDEHGHIAGCVERHFRGVTP